MNKITLDEFFSSKEELVIHCNTEEKANILLKEFDKLGKKWRAHDSYLKNNKWGWYLARTCYSNQGGYADLEFYTTMNNTIYEFEDIEGLNIEEENDEDYKSEENLEQENKILKRAFELYLLVCDEDTSKDNLNEIIEIFIERAKREMEDE